MGLYTVVKPCVVGLLHYVRPTAAPIEVDDDVAAPLVAAGSLVSYGAEKTAADPGTFPLVAPEADKPVRGPRARKAAED